MVFISVFVYFFSINKDQTIQTVSLPVTNKVVIIDAGHGSTDEGGVAYCYLIKKQLFLNVKKVIKSNFINKN